jgi:hypothetical protein
MASWDNTAKGAGMATPTLAEMAGDLLITALRSDQADDYFREITAIFEQSRADPPVYLFEQTRMAWPLTMGERWGLATRWQRLFEELLAAHPDAQPSLLALIEDMLRASGAALTYPPAERA